jgi:hypothetical protein
MRIFTSLSNTTSIKQSYAYIRSAEGSASRGCISGFPKTSSFGTAGGMNRSAEGSALCRGSGPRIWGMQKRVPEKLIFLLRRRKRQEKKT